MPKKLEMKLKREANKKGLNKERTGAYVYGTMRKMGVMPNVLGKTKGVKSAR